MTHDDYHRHVLEEIRQWEARGPNLLTTVSAGLLGPARKATDALIPASVQEEVTWGLEQLMHKLEGISHRLIDPVSLQGEVQFMTGELGIELLASDRVARRCWGWNLAYAGAGGALTGIAGWAGLVLDVPALFTLAMRTVQEIAVSFGFDISTESERDYIRHLMTVGSCGDVETKVALVAEIKKVEFALLREATVRLGGNALQQQLLRTTTREAAQTLGVQLARRKSLQVVPLVGAAFGAACNAFLINDLAESAYMSYRRRRLAELDGSLSSN